MKAARVISWWKRSVLCCLAVLLRTVLLGQCTAPYLSVTYDTLIAGTSVANYAFSLRQFDPSLGTLVSTQIHSVVSLNYGFTLKNVETVSRDFSVSVIRNDNFQSPAMASSYAHSIDTTIGSYPLAPGASVVYGPSTVLFRYDNTDSISSNISGFLGTGAVPFTYKTLTYTNLTGSNNYYYSATANDTVHFSVTYFYCSNTVLPATLVLFSAQKTNDSQITLRWETDNEKRGRIYEVQESADGTQFTGLVNLPADAGGRTSDYSYPYPLRKGAKGKLYFRLRITDTSEGESYSATRMVDLGGDPGAVGLFPNPSDAFIQVRYQGMENSHWRVDIFSANGSLIQSQQYAYTELATVIFNNKFTPGTYFARVTNLDSQNSQVLPFIVR